MAQLTQRPLIAHADTTTVDDSAVVPVGTRMIDTDNNEYIYLKGVASTEANSWVTYDEAYATTLLAANGKGAVAIAMAATVADKYGWYQIYGSATGKVATGFADNGLVYATSTGGTVDDAVVTGDLVVGAIGRSAISSGTATMQLSYPFITDALG